MASKYYAVYKGRSGEPKIFRNWDSCKMEVRGIKGAIYKSFTSFEEARNFIDINFKNDIKDYSEDMEESFLDKDGLTIYVDGSFSLEENNYSYGFVAIENGEVIHTSKGRGKSLEGISLRNVTGEIEGAMEAINYAIKNGYKKVSIVFDYQGIQSWAIGTWKRNNKITEGYHNFIKEKKKEIDIKFIKVKGHSGDKYNDMADSLAKEALGII